MNAPDNHQIYEKDRAVQSLFVKEVSPRGPESERPPILMVHGGCHGWWAYEKWLPFFASRGWRSYGLSLRNHTGSYEVPPTEYLRLTVKDYVADVLNVVNWLGTPPVLLGHSMGGIVAQKAAERIDLRALVLLCSVGPGQLGPMRDPLPLDRGVMLPRSTVRELWFYRIDEPSLDSIYQRLVPESPSVINEYSSGTLAVNREAISCPVVVVSAEHDRSAVHKGSAVAEFFQADRIVVPNSGHDLMLEPEGLEAAAAIEHWLNANLQPA